MSTPFSPTNGGKMFITPGSGTDAFSTSSDISRILPRQLSTGSTRGTQAVGYGQTKIDGSNNRITLGSGIILDGDSETISISDSIRTVLTMGRNTDATFNFRVLDANGIGLAQFGQFPDGSTALKVAQAGIEVSTATLQQLTFSSSASFTVALQNSYVFPSFGLIPDNGRGDSGTIVIPHNVGFIPGVNCFAPLTVGGYSFSTAPTGFPLGDISLFPNGNTIQQAELVFFNFYYAVDATNLYIGLTFVNSSGAPVVASSVTIYYTVFTLNTTRSIS